MPTVVACRYARGEALLDAHVSFATPAHRNGTSMISLIIPPRDQISRVSKMLSDE